MAAVILLLPIALFPILRIPAVQTYVVKGITRYISNETNSTISIGDIEFSFFNRLIANNILIKDHNNDTLLYTPRVTAAINHFNNKKGIIVLNRLNIVNPVVGLITDSTGVMNLRWYLDLIRNTSDSSKKKNTLFHISRIELTNGRFSLVNRINPPSGMLVNFNDMNLSGIDASVRNLEIRDDSLYMDINSLKFRERSGFVVRNITSDLRISGTSILFSNAVIKTDSSLINADKVNIIADSVKSFERFTDEVKLDIELIGSEISLSDLGYFLPYLRNLHDSIGISGKVSGTVSELRGRNINVSYRKETYLDCEFDLSGLPDIDNTFIFLGINDFRSISSDIEKIDIPGKGYIEIPDQLKKLGLVSFSGTFTGFTTDFVTYGKINTNKGIISTDISLRPEGDRNFRIHGLVEGNGIDLGTLTGNDLLGNLYIETNVDGTTNSFKTFSVNLSGKIDSVGINDYLYRNIELNGNFTDKTWDGNIKIDEENLHLDLLGLFDFSAELPEFDFTLNLQNANLCKLNLDKSDTSSRASLLLTANFKGNNIDNLDGEIKLLNSNFRKYSNNLEVFDFSLKTFSENNVPSIELMTDFADANLKGYYNFAGLGNVARKVIATLIPSKFEMPDPSPSDTENNFVFDVKLKKTTSLNEFLRTGIRITDNSMITGSVLRDSVIKLTANANTFMVNNNLFRDFKIDAEYSDTTGKVNIKSSSLLLGGISELKDLDMDLLVNQNYFDLDLMWDDKDKIINKGNFEAKGTFMRDPASEDRTILTINLLRNDIYVRNNLWRINPSQIIIDSSSVKVSSFSITNNENFLLVNGALSENTEDTLYLRLNGIDLNPLNALYEKKMGNAPDMIHLSLAGTLSGNFSITNVYRNFMFESSLSIHDFALLESQYGEISIGSVWNNISKVADITAYNNYNGIRMFDVSGSYDPDAKNMDIAVRAEKLPVDVLNPLLKVFASDISGTATGLVRLTGPLNKPVLAGALYGDNASLKVDYLQTRYTFSDSIRFDKTGIRFRNIQCKDPKGNTATLNGTVFHNSFKDFGVDLTVRTNECMVLDTRSKDNDMFYGTAYASGVTTIKTDGQVLRFDISARTGKNTKFYIPLNTGSSVAENSFVTFVDHNSTEKNAEEEDFSVQPPAPASTQLEINFDLEVTPEAEVQLIMDPKAGDIMKGTGTGNLNISLDRKGEFKIYGDYIIDNGDYLFTLGNIINKPFSVESGGKISFNGDLEDADIDIKAIYTTKAALSELSSTLVEEQYKLRLPVECQLLLSGNLFNPIVKFDINLPTANEESKSYLRSRIQSEEDMSKQVLFLLVMNQFYDADQAKSQTATGIGSATVGVTTMEMLSNQLSNWLSQISNDFDIDVNYRPGSTVLPNSQELQVALSTQVLNDRVSINGNFDVAGSQAAKGRTGSPTGNNSITGAFDIEYKINEKIRFKFFNRSNDNFYIDNGVQYTQGIGLFYRQEFNKLKDLFKKQEKGEMKKEKDAKVEKE